MDGGKRNRTRRSAPRRRRDGFTLVETMVAMVILAFGLIAALSATGLPRPGARPVARATA